MIVRVQSGLTRRNLDAFHSAWCLKHHHPKIVLPSCSAKRKTQNFCVPEPFANFALDLPIRFIGSFTPSIRAALFCLPFFRKAGFPVKQ